MWERSLKRSGTTGISLCTQMSKKRSLSSCSNLELNSKRTLDLLPPTLSLRSRYWTSSKCLLDSFQQIRLQERVKSSFWKEKRTWTRTQINGMHSMVSLWDFSRREHHLPRVDTKKAVPLSLLGGKRPQSWTFVSSMSISGEPLVRLTKCNCSTHCFKHRLITKAEECVHEEKKRALYILTILIALNYLNTQNRANYLSFN